MAANTMVNMKIIVHPGNKTDLLVFSEDRTVQDVRMHISEFLQFTGSRSPTPNDFRIWQIHPRRELDKPTRTLHQMQVPRDCALLVLPPDQTPPKISSLEQLNQVLSSFNFNGARNNTAEQRSNQDPAITPPNQNGDRNPPTTEESGQKEKNARKRKSKNEKTKKAEVTSDEHFVESVRCKICFKSFESKRGARTHYTKMHQKSKDATASSEEAYASAVKHSQAVKRDGEEPKKKKTKENQSDVNINITVTNTVNYYNNFGLGRGDFY